MRELLSLTWYTEEPLDLEYKEYILLAYIQKVENSFQEKKLSPHLLHMERIIDEMVMFDSCFAQLKKTFDKNRYVYFENKKLEGENNSLITEIKELVDFSIPQVQTRINHGYKILKKNRQILF